ncbi:MAG: glycosyltransferase, partial [Acidobacteriota bacterium]|nr:glycosyltransferase [Acidobacteriota bacterium]
RKLNNLARLAREACHDLLVVSDSDVRVAPDYLRQVAMHFQDSTVGLVTAFFRGAVAGTLGARLEALVAAAETVPNALVAGKVEKKIQFAFGWTMATTKAHLRGIGGFEGMINCHSDDFEIGNRIAARGLRIALLPSPVEVVLPRQTLREYWRHELRWAVGLRNVRFGGYLGLLLTFGLPWTILAMIFSRSLTLAALYLAAYLFFRLTQVWITAAWALDDASMRRNLWLVPLRDVINLLIWVEALFTTTISWRGTSYRVRKGLLCSTNSVL